MKTNPSVVRFVLAWLALLVTGLALAGCGGGKDSAPAPDAAGGKPLYTCGMHPTVIQDHPGNCPICGMKLTPVRQQPGTGAGAATNHAAASGGEHQVKFYKSTMLPGEVRPTPGKDSMGMDMVPVYDDEAAAAASATIAIDAMTIQTMDIRTDTVRRGPLRRTIRTVGTVDYNEATMGEVSTKFKGWIEKLHVNTTGQLAMRGETLFEIYSPDLYSAQAEYLLATSSLTNATPGAEGSRASARTKLRFFDIPEAQITELERTRQPRKTMSIVAPQDGFVVEKNVVEGQMVDAGMRIYRLADLGLVWVQADIYEQDLGYIKLGQEALVTLSYLPDREFRGRVTYIYPRVDEKTRTARVRMEFHNPGYFLKPGMFATVKITAELEPSALLIPDMAILRSGEKTTVFVALAGGKFAPRSVTLGPQSENDEYQVLGGVEAGERIVTSGQFMLDSESQLREAIQKMLAPAKVGEPAAAPASAPAAAGRGAAAMGPGGIKFICPMPEHLSIEYDQPGKCAICGMPLVPVTPATLKQLQPGGKILYYACPMPEHSDVHFEHPGKCPQCGMTLIPITEAPPLPPAHAAGTNQVHAAPSPGRGMEMPDGMVMPAHQP